MSIPQPTTTVPPLGATDPHGTTALPSTLVPSASTSALVPSASLQMGTSAAPRALFTPEQTTAAIVDLSAGVAELRLTMQSVL